MLIRLLIIVFVFFSSENDPEKMSWNENSKLTWEDFQGEPKLNSGYVASTNSGISFSYSFSIDDEKLSYDYKVSSFFYPESSWYIASKVDENILNHEQTHFDISELHARILRKKIDTFVFTKNIKKEIERIYAENEEDRVAMQHLFDKESDHSKNYENEQKWETYVKKEILVHEPWR